MTDRISSELLNELEKVLRYLNLLPTGSEEREVLGVGSIPVAILPPCQYMTILHHVCIDMNIVG